MVDGESPTVDDESPTVDDELPMVDDGCQVIFNLRDHRLEPTPP